MPYISTSVAVSSLSHLYCCDLKATQVNWAVSQAEFGLCNIAVVGHSSRNQKTHLMPVKLMTLLCFIRKTHFCSFIFTLACLPLLCPYLASSSVLYSRSHFELLSLFLPRRETKYCCYGNCSERGSLWDFQCGHRGLYMAISCLQAGRRVRPSMNIVSHFPVNETFGVTDWDWGKRLSRQRERCTESDLVDIDH